MLIAISIKNSFVQHEEKIKLWARGLSGLWAVSLLTARLLSQSVSQLFHGPAPRSRLLGNNARGRDARDAPPVRSDQHTLSGRGSLAFDRDLTF